MAGAGVVGAKGHVVTPVDQLVLRDPTSGVRGDCLRAVIASLLDLPPSVVPHFLADADADGRSDGQHVAAFLAPLGLAWIDPYVTDDLETRVALWAGHHAMMGPGPRGCWHAVVGYRGTVVHDPHPSRAGLTLVKRYGFLVRT